MKHLFTILAVLCVCLAAACTQGASSQQDATAISINGQKITAAELVSHPIFRAPLKQYILTESMLKYASERGFKADEDKIDEEFQNIEMAATQQGLTAEEFMDENGSSIEEWRESTSIRLIFEAMLEAEVEVTDAELEQEWITSGDRHRQMYARTHGLTDEESAGLTFEDLKDTITEAVKANKRGIAQESLLQKITDSTDFKILCMSKDDAERNEYVIFNHAKTEEMQKQQDAVTPEERILQQEIEKDQAREAEGEPKPEGGEPKAPEGEEPAPEGQPEASGE